MPPEDETEQISEMVGVVKPWEKVDLYLDNWEYRVWEGWIGRGPEGDQKADLLKDVLHQFDNNATVAKGPSKSDPNALTYSFKFSLGGNPDGVVDAITTINEAFLALDNYKVISGKLYAIVYYADGEENMMDLTPQLRDARGQPKGIDINDAVQMALDAVTQGHAPESQWERPTVCPKCGEKMHSNDEIAQHYMDFHPNEDIGNVYREEANSPEEWAKWMSGLPGETTTDLDEYGRVKEKPTPPVNPEDLQKKDEGRWDYVEHNGDEPTIPTPLTPPTPKVYPPKPTAKDWAKTVKPEEESMQFCKYCESVLSPNERGWSACQRCINDINEGKEPGSWKGVRQMPEEKTEAGGMPDLSYRGSPMGVNAAQTGQPKWEDESLTKVDKILYEIEDIVSEHDFYVRIRDMLLDLAKVVDMINEPSATPAEPATVPPEPQVAPHLNSSPVGPKSEVNNQRATSPTGGQPHNYTQGQMGKCAICGLPQAHYAHFGS
jgi:DNA-directed RNA polymerase subunit M/transcription elongation factor TFIIS